MIPIFDRRAECDDGKHRQRGVKITGVMMHMFGVPGVHDASGIARFYRHNPEWTGGQMPYTYVVDQFGGVELALDLGEVGPHARRWSAPHVGIVGVGDFNASKPRQEQWESAGIVCALLSRAYDCPVFGHTETPGATKYPGKQCPGRHWPMGEFRDFVASIKREDAIATLAQAVVYA